jgi:hypothetical protein
MKLAIAVIPSATRGGRAREEIIVATTLLESWIPFRKSNMRESTMTEMVSIVVVIK